MSYHPFNKEGHPCPSCDDIYNCTMEDGFCENVGICYQCVTLERNQMDAEEREWREMMQSEYDAVWS